MKFLLRLFKRNPIAFLLSSALTAAVVAATLVSFAAILVSVNTPRILRERFMDRTGFFMSSENIFVNIFTGAAEIDNLHISPPQEFKDGDFFFADKIRLKFDPWEFLKGKLLITEISVNAQKLKCVKISASRYSVRDFIYSFPAFAEFAEGEGFKSFKMQIGEIDYIDNSDPKMPLKWNSKEKFELELGGISSAEEWKKAAEKAFEKAGAS
ncbi:MAG: hypothetical protein IKO42_00360, partial [Opitutales bacterium]|nr:hypothetical protein [Opitutales bacterium]